MAVPLWLPAWAPVAPRVAEGPAAAHAEPAAPHQVRVSVGVVDNDAAVRGPDRNAPMAATARGGEGAVLKPANGDGPALGDLADQILAPQVAPEHGAKPKGRERTDMRERTLRGSEPGPDPVVGVIRRDLSPVHGHHGGGGAEALVPTLPRLVVELGLKGDRDGVLHDWHTLWVVVAQAPPSQLRMGAQ